MIYDVIYQEKIKTPFIVLLIFIIVAIFLCLLNFFPGFFNLDLTIQFKLILTATALTDLLLLISFSRLSIELYPDRLMFFFGIFKTTLYKDQIKSVIVEDFNLKEWGGYGIRFRKKTWGYIAKGGRGLRIKLPDRDYYISTVYPEKLKELIERYVVEHEKRY
jgi:hypothetical protein